MLVVISGVSGSGKSTIGRLVAEALCLPFFDADDFHPKSNVEKMRSGSPLNDEDRWPWLEDLSQQLNRWESQGGAVLACSALRECYRERLGSGCKGGINWVILTGAFELLQQRINARGNHFFDASLLASQLSMIELPDYGLTLDVELSPETIVKAIVEYLGVSLDTTINTTITNISS